MWARILIALAVCAVMPGCTRAAEPPTAAPTATPVPAPTPTATPTKPTPTSGFGLPTATPTLPGSTPVRGYRVDRLFPTLTFSGATGVHQAPDGSARLFVIEQAGRILTFPTDTAGPTTQVFLDIRTKVNTQHNEEGLLGLAFDPGFATNRHLYVYYSADKPRRNVLSRFTAEAGLGAADSSSELVLLESPKPYGNHNGGQLAFGPDGFLYVGIGDGGGDNRTSAQNNADLLGAILRIDPANPPANRPYAIPADNPFVGQAGVRSEVWAYGFRNPWRFSFDPTGQLWVADVGESAREEVDIVKRGANYGWPIFEGTICQIERACSTATFEPPVWEYTHADGCSITGGYVAQDTSLPALSGRYVFADFCSGRIWALGSEAATPGAQLLLDSDLQISSFGQGRDGALYIVSHARGLWKLVG